MTVVMMPRGGAGHVIGAAFDVAAAYIFGLDNGVNDIMLGKLFAKLRL